MSDRFSAKFLSRLLVCFDSWRINKFEELKSLNPNLTRNVHLAIPKL
jgi:hypothetical protein